MTDLRARIRQKLGGTQLVNLATVTEEGIPWVRYVMGATEDDLTMRIATFASSRKAAHIAHKPHVHISCGVKSLAEAEDYLQIQATARVSLDEADRLRVWHDGLKTYFSGPDDPNLAVIVVKPYRIELQAMSSMQPEVWEAS